MRSLSIFGLVLLLAAPGAADPIGPGSVVVLRHALAPGVGDPEGFRLDDCATQRNLDERGRAQAEALGRALAARGLGDAVVFTSRWCRSRETAALLGLGPVRELEALDSFFGRPERRDVQDTALRAFLAARETNGEPLVLVTHQVNVSALVGRRTRSGDGFVLRLDGDGTFTLVERLTAPTPRAVSRTSAGSQRRRGRRDPGRPGAGSRCRHSGRPARRSVPP